MVSGFHGSVPVARLCPTSCLTSHACKKRIKHPPTSCLTSHACKKRIKHPPTSCLTSHACKKRIKHPPTSCLTNHACKKRQCPKWAQAQPSRLHYEGLQLYSQPASPDEVWKSLKKLSKGSQIQLKHYRGFVGPYKAYADMSGLEFSLLYLSGLKETDSLLDIGCGALRLGRVVLPYLLPGKYHCIEPNSWLVPEALHYEIGEQILWLKQPKFAFNDKFQASTTGRLDFQLFDCAIHFLSHWPGYV